MNREFLLVLIATGYTVCHDKELGVCYRQQQLQRLTAFFLSMHKIILPLCLLKSDDGNDTYEQQLNITIKKSKPG